MGHNVSGSLFEAILDAVKDKYDKDALSPDIDDERWKIGRLQGMGQYQANGVSWRRPSGTVEPVERAGVHQWADAAGNAQYFSAMYQELATVTATIKGADWVTMNGIWTSVLASTQKVLGINCTPGAYTHITEGDDDPDPTAQKGVQELTQSWEWKILIPHTVGTLTEIATITGTTHLINVNPDPGTAGPTITQPLP